jgi:prepilin peptidase CpaA
VIGLVPEALAIAALACLVAAAIADIRAYEIPDGLSIALLATAIGYGVLTPGFGWLSHGAAVLLMFGIGLLLFARGWMGGGDVKLLVAIAGWTGLSGLVGQLTAVALAGGMLALVLIIARRVLAGRPAKTLPKLFRPDAPLPYAIAIAAGTGWWAQTAWPII